MPHRFYDDVVIHDALEVKKIKGYDITLPQALDTVKNLQYRYMNKQPISFNYTEERLHHFYVPIGAGEVYVNSTAANITIQTKRLGYNTLEVYIDCPTLGLSYAGPAYSSFNGYDLDQELSTQINFQPCVFDYYPDKRLIIPTADVTLPKIEKPIASVNYYSQGQMGRYNISLYSVELYVNPNESFYTSFSLSWSGTGDNEDISPNKTTFNLSPQTQGECYVFPNCQIDTTNLRPILPR